ncbi:DUF6011 domain-containing protein [Bradyrhizobium sp. 521_C7_N1_3]|uniref:DUF6011 domain-containing protein n=1 Tax=Bradyrhizobium sp. 521_C7_N1_3 TaxID=3240368 RepID=UPI003F8B1ABB
MEPKFPRNHFGDYASTAEYDDVIHSLKQAWRDLGRAMRANPDSNAKAELSHKRHELNIMINNLREQSRLPLYFAHEELAALVPLLGEIEARYTAARDAWKVAHDRWWESRPPVDNGDEAWAAELKRRQEWEEDARQNAERRAAWEAGREERERQQREEAIARGVASRARRREEKFRKAVQDLRDHALRPGTICRCCGKYLTDPPSIARSIGPECWEIILKRIERRQTA